MYKTNSSSSFAVHLIEEEMEDPKEDLIQQSVQPYLNYAVICSWADLYNNTHTSMRWNVDVREENELNHSKSSNH